MLVPCVAVVDVGKTHAKVTLWNESGTLLGRRDRRNKVVETPFYRALDAIEIESWLAVVLTEFATLGHITAIIPVGHAAAAVVIRDGMLACPPIDYEQPIPEEVQRRYGLLRDDFSETGSPRLPQGLNLGAQLFWLEEFQPHVFQGDARILPWAQYWAWVFCGVMASEVTSLGSHTDLWRPFSRNPSSLAEQRGWAEHLAPVHRAGEVLGKLSPQWARRTGLSATTNVLCGIHDSNAALLAARGFKEIADHDATVISTGTWFLAMRSPANCDIASLRLAEGRDCLINIDSVGSPIPTARFMGGREIELLTTGDAQRLDDATDQPQQVAATATVIRKGSRALPTLAPGVGPYPHARFRWDNQPPQSIERRAATALYAALVADTSLDLVGARERILVEGRFADSEVFVRALASLRLGAAVYASNAHNGVPYGALRLIDPSLAPPSVLRRVEPLPVSMESYKAAWRQEADRLEAGA